MIHCNVVQILQMMKQVVTERYHYDTLHCCSSITSDDQIGCYYKITICLQDKTGLSQH